MNFLVLIVTFLLFFSSIDAKTHTILFRNGENIKGSVVMIGITNVTFKKRNGAIEEIPKKQIMKLIFKDASINEIEKIWEEALKKEWEKRLVKEEKEKEERQKLLEDLKLQKSEEEKKKLANLKPLEKPKNASYYIYSPNTTSISLANSNAECSILKEFKQWYILFGSVPISEIKTDEMFLEDGQYRVYTKATLADSILSVVLGLTTSFTRKTIFIESCKSDDIFILQKNELDTLLDKQKENTSEAVIQEMEEEDSNFREKQNGKKK